MRVFVAGHRGLVGSALVRALRERGITDLLLRSRSELDLSEQATTRAFFQTETPDLVFLAAARVGGIQANRSQPADFAYDNLSIQNHVIGEAFRAGVRRLIFLGSSCIYPRDCDQPMKESALLTGPLEPTNRPYAVAKIAGIELCWALNRQHGTRYLAVMPTNLYGVGDNYDLEGSHVLPALIRKFHEAKATDENRVELWGTGAPLREFLFCDDLAEACVHLATRSEQDLAFLFNEREPPLVNVGSGSELSIRELASLVAQVVGFEGEIAWDPSRPDGTPRKLLDSSRMASLGWTPSTDLVDGVQLAYDDYLRGATAVAGR